MGEGYAMLHEIVNRARALPAALLGQAVVRLLPQVCEDLGAYQQCTYLIIPTDSPLMVEFQLNPHAPFVRIHVRGLCGDVPAAVVIRGTTRQLMKTLMQKADGDALFFSRHVELQGDIEALLALRNTLERNGKNAIKALRAYLPFLRAAT